MIGEANRTAIRKIEFSWGGDCPKQQMLVLVECVNLRVLHIGINLDAMVGMGYRGNIWNTYRVSTLREIRGLVDLDLKVRQVSSCCSSMNLSTIFQESVQTDPRQGLGPWEWPLTHEQVREFEAVPQEELRRERVDGKVKIKKQPNVVKRVTGTSILGVEVKLAESFRGEPLQLESVVLGKRQAAVEGEERRKAAVEMPRKRRATCKEVGKVAKQRWSSYVEETRDCHD
jgi:hypothetical protein